MQAQRAAHKAAEEYRRNVDGLPATAEEFRNRMHRFVASTMQSQIIDVAQEFGEGFDFDAASMRRIRDAADRLIEAVGEARVVSDQTSVGPISSRNDIASL